MNGSPASGDTPAGERFQATRPGGAGLFWPSDRHLFRRRRAPGGRLAVALVLAGAVAVLVGALAALG